MNKILKYSEFIKEGRLEIIESEWVKLFKEHCKLYKHNDKLLYRGTSYKGDFGLFTSDSLRKPSGAGLKWVTYLDVWKNYPKRDKSLIFTNNIDTAKDFSMEKGFDKGIYIIIPFDAAKIGITPSKDFNMDSFKYYSFLSEKDFVWFVFSILKYTYPEKLTKDQVNNMSDMGKLEKAVNNFFTTSENKIVADFENLSHEILDITDKEKITPWEAFQKILSPEYNEFKLITYKGDNNSIGSKPHELWTEGNCLMIKKERYNKLLKEGVIPKV